MEIEGHKTQIMFKPTLKNHKMGQWSTTWLVKLFPPSLSNVFLALMARLKLVSVCGFGRFKLWAGVERKSE